MYKRDVTVIDIASSGSNFSEIFQKCAFVAKRSLITMTTAIAGSCTVIDGNDSQWDKKTHKLYSKNEIGNVPGHYLHFDGSLLKADGGDTDNGEKK